MTSAVELPPEEAWRDADALERGRLLFAGPCEFVTGVAELSQLPESGLPEIAFAGRSNVGKSSLINGLTNRKALARASSAPGRTRQINFFVLHERVMLVDLPGYGYAKAPRSEARTWNKLVNAYLAGRQTLLRTILLIDARHGLKPADDPVMQLLDSAAVSYQAVMTKSDKLKPPARPKVRTATLSQLSGHAAAHPSLLFTSASDSEGLPELRSAIAALVDGP